MRVPAGPVRRLRVSFLGALAALASAACSPPPVDWAATHSAGASSNDVTLNPAGDVVADSMLALAARIEVPGVACAGSLRIARAGRTLFAVWWSPRPDSGARLLSAHSADGGSTWSAVASVDTTDRGLTGCHRSPPAIAADSVSGYVHITYALLAPEGPGLFFAHSMDGGATFHSPVPILYGDRLGRTSVAASGDVVVVAFEDPNSVTPGIGLALSRTMGHIFKNEDRILPVSDDNGSATYPLVAVQGHHLTVAWQEGVAGKTGLVLRVRGGNIH